MAMQKRMKPSWTEARIFPCLGLVLTDHGVCFAGVVAFLFVLFLPRRTCLNQIFSKQTVNDKRLPKVPGQQNKRKKKSGSTASQKAKNNQLVQGTALHARCACPVFDEDYKKAEGQTGV